MIPFELIDWPCPAPGGTREEMALTFDHGRAHRLLVLPAWFDEANKLRRQTVEIMRRLDLSGIDSFLPDLPGSNESDAPLADQTLDGLRVAAAGAASHFRATHVLAIRAGGMVAPPGLLGWSYASLVGRQALRSMVRARTIAAKEAGQLERTEDLQELARRDGIELAGWNISAAMFCALEAAESGGELAEIDQATVGGTPLWLRAEPDENPEQADTLAAIVAIGMLGQ